MRKILRKCILLLLMASLSIPQVIAGVANKDYKEGVIYVSPKGSSDGTSWENATDNLNEALKIAEKQSLDVYVSSGTFSGNKDSLSAFVIPEGVNVYGGFAGTESSPKERNLNKNKTILSGQNLQRVLYQPKDFTDTTFSIWDGFVIEKGTFKEDDEYRGAGVYMRDYCALVNCEIRNNSSIYNSSHGLGVYVDEARHSILENCLIHHNTTAKDENDEYVTVYGSGIYCSYGSNIINCTIADNVSSSGDYAVDLSGSHNEMYNTIVYGNKNINYLGEPRETKNITVGGSSNVHHCAIECVIEHGNNNYNVQSSDFNEDYSLKQGSVCLDMSTTYEALSTIDLKGNKRVQGKRADLGAIESSYTNSIQPDKNGIIYVKSDGTKEGSGSSWDDATSLLQLAINTASLTKSKVYVAAGTYKGDTSSKNAFSIVEGVKVYGGFSGTEKDPSERDLKKNKTILTGQNAQRVLYQPNHFTDSTMTVWDGFVIEKGTFKENDEYRGAGVYMRDYSALVNCEIRNNSSSYDDYNYGLGVYVDEARHSILENCLIHHNTTAKDENDEYVTVYGSGIYCYYGSNIINCTIADNISQSGEYAVDLSGSHNEMYNTIVYGNKNINYLGEPRETKSITIGGSSYVHHCAIEGFIEHGNNNYNVQSSDFNEDYSLKEGSVCLDMSTPYEALSTIDLKGNKRVQGKRADLGAIESSYTNSIQPDKNGIIYVKADGAKEGSGSSWDDATSLLQLAINTASLTKSKVYVAAGTYKGDTSSKNAFSIVEGVNVYGGFSGTEKDPSERNLKKNKTILTGQNAQRVLCQPNHFTDSTMTVWDGFVIENGTFKEDDEYRGAGVYMRDYSALVNCEIRNNSSIYDDYNYGLGVYVDEARHSILENCLIHHNTTAKDENDEYVTVYGSGIYCYYGSNIINCTIADNVSSSGDYAVDLNGSYNEMYNTIVYGNKNINYLGEPRETKSITIGGSSNVHHCAIEDYENTDDGNISLASENNGKESSLNYVRFINPNQQDYTLHATSVCIDKGIDSVSTTKYDLYSNARIYNARIDMGAIEWDGTYTSMQTYGQTICSGTDSKIESFDQVADHFEWKLLSNDGIEGYIEEGEDSIPAMNLINSTSDTLHLVYVVIPFENEEQKDSFEYDFTVLPLRSLGEIELYNPEDSTISDNRHVYFDWNEVENATLYSLSFADTSNQWTLNALNDRTYYNYDFDNHKSYRWFVTASNECLSKNSDTLNFAIEEASFVKFQEEQINISAKFKSTDSLAIYLEGNELDKSIQLKWIGKDSASFSSKISKEWDEKTGGKLIIYFHPTTENEKFNAQLIAYSNTEKDTLQVTGSISNYYNFTIKTNQKAYTSADTVIFSGSVLDMYEKPIKDKDFEVYLIAQEVNYRRTFNVTTNDKGEFKLSFIPQYSETGYYTYGICPKGDEKDEEMGSFDIVGLQVIANSDWITTVGETMKGEIYIRNKSRNVTLTDLKIKEIKLSENCKVTFKSVDTLVGGKSAYIQYEVEASEASKEIEKCEFKVTSKEGASATFSVDFFAKSPEADLKSSVTKINTTMTKNATKTIAIPLYNNGSASTGEIQVSLPAEFTWMNIMYGTTLPELAPGDSTIAYLTLSPDDDIELGNPYKGIIYFNSEKGEPLPISFDIEAVSTEMGSLSLEIMDEYYYASSEQPHLSNATVLLQKMYSSDTVAFEITDETGILSFDPILEGTYLLTVRADHHSEYKEYITIDANRNLEKTILLNYQAVTYTWDVVRTEVEDEYQIDLIVSFETNVPVPTVTLDLNRELPRLEDIQDDEEVKFSLIMTNHGLIAARDVEVNFPELDGYEMIPLFDKIDSLPAKYTQVIPVVLRKAKASTRAAGGNYCVGINAVYGYICGNAMQHGSASTKQLWDYECLGPSFIPGGHGHGGSGGGGFPTGIGFGSGGPSTTSIDLCSKNDSLKCDPTNAIINCMKDIIGEVTGAGTLITLADCGISVYENGVSAKAGFDCATGFIPFYGCGSELIKFILCKGLQRGLGTPVSASPKARLKSYTVSDKTWLNDEELLDQSMIDIYMVNRIYENRRKICVEYFGNESAIDKNGFSNFIEEVRPNIKNEEPIDWELISKIPVSELSVNEMWAMADYYNHTLDAWKQGEAEPANFGNLNVVNACLDSIQKSIDYIDYRGYKNDVQTMVNEALEVMKVRNQKHQSGVCAKIKLLISQTLTMTREAFEGTLTITNNRDTSLNAIDMQIEILDEEGNVANDLFQINVKSLSNLNDVLGEGVLSSQQTGSAVFQFIPTKNAAPTEAKHYSFGGTFSYVDPYTGDTIKEKMVPVWMTVEPSPNLVIDYFMQRDILGDDALTEDRVEPIIPAALGVMINNVGYGDAKNVMLSTAQPKIIENKKGLLIDFKIIGSSLNGLDCQLGSEKINFGTIPAKNTSVGVWWLTSSLMGLFTDYEASVTHKSSYGNSYLSLIDTVRIHELIHVARDYKNTDTIPDFLVNDKNDAHHTPDILYLSNGTTENVVTANDAFFDETPLTESDTVILLTVEPSKEGWNYINLDDPSENKFEVVKVTRVSDKLNLPVNNFWQTHVTLTSSSDPVYENKFHFLDAIPSEKPETYQITFRMKQNTLDVISIDSVPEDFTEKPITNLTVTFNEAIKDSTFDYKDIALICQGQFVHLDSSLVVKKVNETQYDLNISNFTKGTGYYELTVSTIAIQNEYGYEGYYGKAVSWIQMIDGVLVTTDTVSKVGGDCILLNGKVEGDTKILSKGFALRKVNDKDWEEFVCDSDEFTLKITHLKEEGEYEYKAFVSTKKEDRIYGNIVRFYTSKLGDKVPLVMADANISVYPNPVKDVLYVTLPEGVYSIQLQSLDGKIIFSQLSETKENTINVSDLKIGEYLLSVSDKKNRWNFKVLKK